MTHKAAFNISRLDNHLRKFLLQKQWWKEDWRLGELLNVESRLSNSSYGNWPSFQKWCRPASGESSFESLVELVLTIAVRLRRYFSALLTLTESHPSCI